MKRRLRQWLARTGIAAVLLAGTACVAVSAAYAHFGSSATAAPTVATVVVGDPSGATASTTDSCATVTVSWTAASAADSYRVQYSSGGGAWIDLQIETGDVTQITDTTGHAATTVTYRVFGRDASSDWEGQTPATTAPLSCP